MDVSDQVSSTTSPTPSRFAVDQATSSLPTSRAAAADPCPTSGTNVGVASVASALPARSSPCPPSPSSSASSSSNTAATNAAVSCSHSAMIDISAEDMSPGRAAADTAAPAAADTAAPAATAVSRAAVVVSDLSSTAPTADSTASAAASSDMTAASAFSQRPAASAREAPAAASSSATSSAAAASPAAPEGSVGSVATSSSSSADAPASCTALAIVVIGMAGSGKSTFVGGLQRHLITAGKRVYTINLDPAAVLLPYESVNIDIRDTVNYKRVMQHYHLGPNGAILTSLNLFATKFGDVLTLLEQRKHTHDYIILDTPGQIEAFTWSASGSIILESLAASLPTCICYILDTPRCSRPVTFMSNMLYSCSVLYKARLPFVGVFNKTDVASHVLCQKWMTDYEAFQEALLTDDTYLASLSRSSALMLVEFYSIIQTAGVSSVTNAGMKGLEQLLDKCRTEYETDFLPFLLEKRKANEAKAKARADVQFAKFMKDHCSPDTSKLPERTVQRSTNPSTAAKQSPTNAGTLDTNSAKRTDEEP